MSDVSPFFLLMRGVFRCLRGFFFLFFQIDASCCAQWKGRVSELTTTKSSWLATTAPPKQTDHCHVTAHIYRYIWCIYGIFGRETTIHTVIYGADIRFWPPLKWSQSCHSKMMTVMSQQNDHSHVTAKWSLSCHSKHAAHQLIHGYLASRAQKRLLSKAGAKHIALPAIKGARRQRTMPPAK